MNIVPNEVILQSKPKVLEIGRPLREQSNINFLVYVKQYDDGSFCDVISNEEWTYHFERVEAAQTLVG